MRRRDASSSRAVPDVMPETLAQRIRAAPRLSRPAVAGKRLAHLLAEPAAPALAAVSAKSIVGDLLRGVADHSPYLWGLLAEDPARAARLFSASPEYSLDGLIGTLSVDADAREASEAMLMRRLRHAKHECALLVALADIGGVWGLTEVTDALSRFADAAVSCALRFLLLEEAAAGRLRIDPAGSLETQCGLVVLALGKHGARELNYSSDVDLIVLFDPDSQSIPEGVAPGPLFVRVTKALARLLQERTSDGYVLRVDLRLRPDPAATPIALSIALSLIHI